MTRRAFVTGASSGLGAGLARALRRQGWDVYGASRRASGIDGVHDCLVDLTDYAQVPSALAALLGALPRLDLVVLNAGMLGRIRDLGETSLPALKQVMEINLWANKVVLDWLLAWERPVEQVVLISSGASVLGNRGWGGYALSKAALNMLTRLYAHEFETTHLTALAPGIVDTPMMDHLCDEADAERYPALQRLRAARGTAAMPTPDAAAARVLEVLPILRSAYPSGAFVDIREILEPEAYARLYGKD
jgi:NAD(P)-dependent dehydrogenase (short-subunit alcohol dehydrogenase family)